MTAPPGVVTKALLMMMLSSFLLLTTEGQDEPPSGMTQEMRQSILQTHNRHRMRVKAKNMVALEWSREMENKAERWVSQCEFGHQPNPTWGENIYRSEFDLTKERILLVGINSWVLERSFFNTDCCNAVINTSLCCNYQQMMWAQTTGIGCALKKCPTLRHNNLVFNNAWFLACYYTPRKDEMSKAVPVHGSARGHNDGIFKYTWCFACFYTLSGNVAGFTAFNKGPTPDTACSECPYTYDNCTRFLCLPSSFCRREYEIYI